MSYTADILVTIADAGTGEPLSQTTVEVEFDAPDDPRALLARVALAQAADDAGLAERLLWT